MKHLIFLVFAICVQIAFAQYTFKYESNITKLEEVGVEKDSKESIVPKRSTDGNYYSKTYKTNLGDTLTIRPKIAVIAKNAEEIDQITEQFGNKLTFKRKLGRVFIFNCNVQHSDEVLKITTILSKDENVIECDAFTNAKIESFNTLYSKQYYLHDNTSGSIGINMESAWEIATDLGKGITVAVLDEGVDHNHEDLPNVLDGYTVLNQVGKGDPINASDAHGVACAGIIGAANNTIGIRGIASNVNIIPVNLCNSNGYVDYEYIAEAVRWASERADVLSCSWGNMDGIYNTTLADAIKYAMTKGRNGKGCVVVFAAGNSGQNKLAFPASVEGVISVGAVEKNGKIWNYSQRGSGLSLVAPSGNGNSSSDIVTTDRMGNLGYENGNYTEHFKGTSAACPQVAGVAALLLSSRPDLTAAEVKDVLQRTATDLGSTGYDTTYGYGLLNAYAAVKEIAPFINGSNVSKSNCTYRIGNFPKDATVTWSVEDKDNINLTVSGDGNINCKAELVGTKTVRTAITAVVKVSGLTVATVTKNIALLGTFSGTYSVPASTINGVNFPAIVNRPFSEGSTLQARAGTYITINSEDLNYYTSSWSGNAVSNWTVGLNYLRFSYPQTAKSATTILEFKSSVGGTARVRVVPIQPPTPPHSINLHQDGDVLNVSIKKEEQEDNLEYSAEEISEMAVIESSNDVWEIEIIQVMKGTKHACVSTSTGELQFDTSTWKPGIYLIQVSNGIESISKKITIK